MAAAVLIAAISIGAVEHEADRPQEVPAPKWVPIGGNAGFAITSDTSGPSVGAELYLKTDRGWRRARLESPGAAMPAIQR